MTRYTARITSRNNNNRTLKIWTIKIARYHVKDYNKVIASNDRFDDSCGLDRECKQPLGDVGALFES